MKKKNPTIQLRESDIRRIKREATDKGLQTALVIFLNVMRDSEGYGVKRLKRVYTEINNLSDSISRGFVSLHDLEKVLEEEANITISMKEEINNENKSTC